MSPSRPCPSSRSPIRTLAGALALALALAAGLGIAPARPASAAQPPPLLSRQILFSSPTRGAPFIAPDGKHLAWIESTNGLPNLWVRSPADPEGRLLSRDPRGTVRQPVWQSDAQAVLYLQDSDGLGNWHLMQAHVTSGTLRDLTPFTGVQARLVATSPRVVDEILVAMNLRDRRLFDVFRIDVRTGAVLFEAENSGEITTWFADDDLNIRLAQVILPNGELALSTRSDPRSMWRPILRWGADDALGKVIGFGPTGTNVLLLSSVRAPAPRLLDINLATGATTIVAQDARFDVIGALSHPFSNTLEAVQFMRDRAQWQVMQPDLARDFTALRNFRDADIDVLSRDVTDRLWTIGFTAENAPVLYALYDRHERTVRPLFSENPVLERIPFANSRPIALDARDGRPLAGYLTLPPGQDPRNLPGVVLVHGGPWSRTIWGFDPEVQWLANRGYAVLQINFRGSTGYGRDHLNAGNQEWGGKILLDLIDGKRWAIGQGYLDPKRVAIMGAGFGGYAALATLAFHPDEFAAGVSLAGPPDLVTMVTAVPTNAVAVRAVFDQRVGNVDTDLALLRNQSPASRAAQIKAPLLAAVTGRDPQVPVQAMDAFVAAVRREGRHVEYLYFADETTVLRQPANRLRFHAATEAFLARHLGGRAEPPAEFEKFEALRR